MFIFVISYKNIHNMKKLFYLLFYLIPFVSFAQISTGQEAEFDYGIRNLDPQTVSNPNYLGTLGSDGTMGQIGVNDFLNGRSAQADTGVLDFGGLTTNSATTINIGFADGYVVNNESIPGVSSFTHVTYPGASNVTVTTVGTGVASYVMLSSAGVISFQNTFPTSAERKAKIWLGKVSHPAGSITLVVNEPDYITSPQALTRDLMQVLGYQNDGVYPYANGANLNINITSGNIHGNGINFVNDRTTPNEIHMGPATVQAFTYRSQTGVGGAVTAVTPSFYDVGGVVTAIPGSSNQATIQYFYAVPGIGYVAQLGQTLYSTFGAAVQALGNRTDVFVTHPSFIGNTIPIAALVVTKGCTALNDTGVTAQFFNANKNGDFYGATAGTSTATLQSTYNNSLVPQITTSTSLGAFSVRRGSASDTNDIIAGQNGGGTITSSINGLGDGYFAGKVLVSGNILGGVGVSDNLVDDLQLTGSALVNKLKYTSSINISSTDLNSLDVAGFYEGFSLTNAPTSGYFWVEVQRYSADNSWVHQRASTFGSGNTANRTYTRVKNGGVWGSWRELAFKDDSPTITITTAVSITTATLDSNSVGQNGKHVVISNGVNPINLTCNGGVTSSYGKVGTGAITFVQGAGRTLVQLSGTAVLNGAVGSTATLWSDGTTDYLSITNY